MNITLLCNSCVLIAVPVIITSCDIGSHLLPFLSFNSSSHTAIMWPLGILSGPIYSTHKWPFQVGGGAAVAATSHPLSSLHQLQFTGKWQKHVAILRTAPQWWPHQSGGKHAMWWLWLSHPLNTVGESQGAVVLLLHTLTVYASSEATAV